MAAAAAANSDDDVVDLGSAHRIPSPAPTMAAAAANSDDDVVDLGGLGDLDDATKIFFSDDDSVGADLSWPAAEGIASALTSEASLRALCDKHGVPRVFRPVCADHMGWAACTTPPVGSRTLCVYAAALDAGLRFPLHDFYVRLLRHYKLAPSQLLPNAWRFLAAFVLRCEELEVEPYVDVFRYFFTICTQKKDGRPTGWHHFQPYTEPGRRLFTGTPPIKAGWKMNFFFLEAPPAMSWKPSARWGKPKWKNARKVEEADVVIEKLKQKGSIDIKVFLAGREMPVGDQVRLQAAVKAEAGAAAGGAAAAETSASARNKRKSPAATQALPTSTAPGMPSFSIGGGAGGALPPQQQIFAAPTRTPAGLAPPASSSEAPPPYLQNFAAGWNAPPQQSGWRTPGPGFPHMRNVHAERRGATPDALQFFEAVKRADEHAAIVAKLKKELHSVNAWNAQWQKQLAAAEAKHAAERAQWQSDLCAATHELDWLKMEYADERNQIVSHLQTACDEVKQLKAAHAQLKAEHAAEKARLKKERDAGIEQLKEEFVADEAQLRKEIYTKGVMDMTQLVLQKFAIDPAELRPEQLLGRNYNNLGCSAVSSEDH